MIRKTYLVLFFLFSLIAFGQVNRNDTIRVENHPKDSLSALKPKSETAVVADIEKSNAPYTKPKFSPMKAGLYSAVLPGLGQVYNKKIWKAGIVWGAIGAGIGGALYSDNLYKKYRNAFVAELNGQPHEFSDLGFNNLKNALGRSQDNFKRQRDYWIAGTALLYILNIVDAVVDAHLYEGKNDPDLAVKPTILFEELSKQKTFAGLSFNYNF